MQSNDYRYVIYGNILKVVDFQKLKLLSPVLTESDLLSTTHTIIKTEYHDDDNNDTDDNANITGGAASSKKSRKSISEVSLPLNKKFFILIVAENNDFYKSASMLKVYKNIPEIKAASRNYNLECITIGKPGNNKFASTTFPKVSSSGSTAGIITHRYIPNTMFYVNILEHALLNYKFKIIKDKERLYNDLKIDKINDKWKDVFPKIYINDPISIWIGLKIGDIIYYDGYYRQCVEE